MVTTSESDTRSRAMLGTPTRWDLTAMDVYPQWASDIERAVRRATSKAYMTGERPTLDAMALISLGKTRAASVAQNADTLADLSRLQDQYDEYNQTEYDIVMASISLSNAQLMHVLTKFKPMGDGKSLSIWVHSHYQEDKESSQLKLENELKQIRHDKLAVDCSSSQAKAVFERIELIYPKIKANANASLKDLVLLALDLFPHAHHEHSLISTLKTEVDLRGPPWESFELFKSYLIEKLAKLEQERIRDGVAAAPPGQAAFPAFQRNTDTTRQNKGKTSKCDNCFILFCGGGDQCVAVNENSKFLAKATAAQRLVAKMIRDYRTEFKLGNVKHLEGKGSIPEAWFKSWKAANPDVVKAMQEQKRAGAKPRETGMPLIDETEFAEMTDDWWQQLDGDKHAFMMIAGAPAAESPDSEPSLPAHDEYTKQISEAQAAFDAAAKSNEKCLEENKAAQLEEPEPPSVGTVANVSAESSSSQGSTAPAHAQPPTPVTFPSISPAASAESDKALLERVLKSQAASFKAASESTQQSQQELLSSVKQRVKLLELELADSRAELAEAKSANKQLSSHALDVQFHGRKLSSHLDTVKVANHELLEQVRSGNDRVAGLLEANAKLHDEVQKLSDDKQKLSVDKATVRTKLTMISKLAQPLSDSNPETRHWV